MVLLTWRNWLLEWNTQFLIGIDYMTRCEEHGSIGFNIGPFILSYHWLMINGEAE